MDYDVLIIGGGPGGYVAAVRAAQLGAKTALAEKAELGGTCLNRGCIPTKTLIVSAEKAAEFADFAAFGIIANGFEIDFPRMIKRKDMVVNRLRMGVKSLLKQNGVSVLTGTARFKDAHTVEVDGQAVTAEKIIIASGSEAKRAKLGEGNPNVLYSDDLLNLAELPQSLAIIGGGVIGVEFAAMFNSLGVKVSVIEILDRILPQTDGEISALLTKILGKKGIDIFTSSRVLYINEAGGANSVIFEQNGEQRQVSAEKVLLALGRAPLVGGLNLEAAGVEYSPVGITTNENMQTNVGHIYAIGDVTGGLQLAHLASAQGIVAAEHALGKSPGVCLKYVPSCIYTRPEAASVGLNEEQLRESGTAYKAARFPLLASGKAQAMGEAEGVFKLLYSPDTGEILGVHLVGPHATDIIGEVCLAMRAGLSAEDIATTIHAHPTIAEALMEAAHIAAGSPIHYKG